MVFSGKVVGKRKTATGDVEVTFRVERVWKGNPKAIAVVLTSPTEDDWKGGNYETYSLCGMWFDLGERYLVYTNEDGKELTVDVCTRTGKLAEVKEDLRALGRSRGIRRNRMTHSRRNI
jgi:hypothetical protein